ncbi:MAG: TolC family protein [Acidobacteriota bacterium]
MTNKSLQAACLCLAVLSCPLTPRAQEAPTAPLRLETAVDLAERNYPAMRAARAQSDAARVGIDVARNTYLPRAEMNWQQTRGTRNNVFGQFFPQPGISPISGPALPNSSFVDSVWGSGGGLLVAWEPFDFGVRKAGVSLANRVTDEAEARATMTQLDVATAAADAFLRVVAAEQAVCAARANVERLEAFSISVHVLVDNQLRPGADASRTDAELAGARSTLIQAKLQSALGLVALAEAIGLAGQAIAIEPGPLVDFPPTPVPLAVTDFSAHPLVRLQRAALDIITARQEVLDRSFFPRFSWQTTVFGRGSGALVDGGLRNDRGFFPDTPNWATGLTISFVPSDIFNLRLRRRQEAINLVAEKARYDQTLQRVRAEEANAGALTASANELAENAPRQLQAAQETELRVRKRYEAELTTVTEVAEAHRLLAQAEVEMALSRLALWRARLAKARATGDLKPFLDLLRQTR